MYSITLVNKFLSNYNDEETIIERVKEQRVFPKQPVYDDCKLDLSVIDDLRILYEKIESEYRLFMFNLFEHSIEHDSQYVIDIVDDKSYEISSYKLMKEFMLNAVDRAVVLNTLNDLCNDKSLEFIYKTSVKIIDIKIFNATPSLMKNIYNHALAHSYSETITRADIIYALEAIINEDRFANTIKKEFNTNFFSQ